MIQLHSIKPDYQFSEEKHKEIEILNVLDNLIKVIQKPDEATEIMKDTLDIYNRINIYPAICLLLGEANDLLSDDVDWVHIHHQYMIKIKAFIEENIVHMKNSLFGGLTGIGYGIYAMNKTSGHYDKFISSLNNIIVETVNLKLEEAKTNTLTMSTYDTISGFAGVGAYLINFREDDMVKECIIKILEFFVSMAQLVEVNGHLVPNYYIPVENQFLEVDQANYPKGNFNLGLSHGITGPLVILSLALEHEITVAGQKDAIKTILQDLNTFKYIDKSNNVYWTGRISFEDYISKTIIEQNARASWCYGTPGIARAMFIASRAIGDKESMRIAEEAIDGLCNMRKEEWLLTSPTICHGYAGLLAVINAMYVDTGKIKYKACSERIASIILEEFHKKDYIFSFYNIDPDDPVNKKFNLVEKADIAFLEGSIGVMLSLLATIKPIKTGWLGHLLL